jgi:CubicO group peptidase (beta-lactamase class C family)
MARTASPVSRAVARVMQRPRANSLFMLVLAWLLVAASAAIAAPAGDAALQRRAQRLLAGYFDAEGPGAAVAVLEGGQVRIAATRGLADLDSGRAIDADTLFDLASVSKHITAAAILHLAEAGELTLDDALVDHVADFAVPVRGRAVTLRDLLLHVSGLPDYSGDAFADDERAFSRLTTQTHLDWLNRQRALRAPGRRYEYNNSGYALLALVVERVSGQAFRRYLRENLFAPAGMPRSEVLDRLGARFPEQARGYTTASGEVERSELPTRITGDGNVYSSLTDMIAWCRALRGNTVLSAGSRRQMFRNGRLDDGSALDVDGYGYGLGWSLDADSGQAFHSGSWNGTATYIAHEFASDRWVIVLSNDEAADVETLGEALLALLRHED